ncbi:MAG: hypothetical protein ABSF34_11365 [Verrucomicrobiota bacterium]
METSFHSGFHKFAGGAALADERERWFGAQEACAEFDGKFRIRGKGVESGENNAIY